MSFSDHPALASEHVERNMGLHRHCFDALTDRRALFTFDDCFADDHILHQHWMPELPAGPSSVKALVVRITSSFTEWNFAIADQFGGDDKIVTRFAATAHHKGALGIIPPTDRWVTITGMLTSRFSSGKIAESWLETNALDVLLQLGVARLRNSVEIRES